MELKLKELNMTLVKEKKKNNQIIEHLAENNYDIFKSVSKKLDNINI